MIWDNVGLFYFMLSGEGDASSEEKENKEHQRKALELMALHNKFYESLPSEEYVPSGSSIKCSKGSHLCTLFLLESHGVYDINGNPLTTVDDCATKNNLYDFGICIGRGTALPATATIEMAKYTSRNKATMIKGQKCVPILNESWMQQNGTQVIDSLKNDSVDLLRGKAVLACVYGGIITIDKIPEQESPLSYEDMLRTKGFTEPYITPLVSLHNKYPEWIFEPDIANVDYSTFVNDQYTKKQKCAEVGSGFGDGTAFKEEKNYYNATKDAIAFLVNPLSMMTYGKGNSGDYERVMQFLDYNQKNLNKQDSSTIVNS